MDPLVPATYNHRYDTINGIRYHYVDEGPKDGLTVVLLHGFPDLWYGWRYQIKFLAERGYRVICPDLRGYGETDSPHCPPNDIRTYGAKSVSSDVIEILNRNSINRFVLIGHDWGGFLVWRVYLHYPERVMGIVSFCTPYAPPKEEYISHEEIVERLPSFSYQLMFREPEADKYCDDNVELVFRSLFKCNRPEDDVIGFLKHFHFVPQNADIPQPAAENILSPKELQYYVEKYTQRKFHGGLNWYRTNKVNWEDERGLSTTISVPSMMVTAGRDTVLHRRLADHMPQIIPNLRMEHIEDSSHWILVEQTATCNQYIAKFLSNLTSKL
ncbi:hypothetical protein K7432_005668 [Basidiobolus ranarum]|uniref:AB hydrolase-1 domain-containing protein n=1 Tax=Basidiobolus ranarum TaxID=34480 RepID=A0ABR2W2R0_9FUNG